MSGRGRSGRWWPKIDQLRYSRDGARPLRWARGEIKSLMAREKVTVSGALRAL